MYSQNQAKWAAAEEFCAGPRLAVHDHDREGARYLMAKGRKGRKNPDNRIRPLLNKLSGAEAADDIMNELIVVLSDSQVQVPQAGAILCVPILCCYT